jgi:AcrR family transcriptional regulator
MRTRILGTMPLYTCLVETKTRSYHPPRRRPARETLEKIVVAAEEQLREEELDSFTVQSVILRAGLSVGAFYSRFPDKTALIHEVQERVHDRVDSLIVTDLETLAPQVHSLQEAVGEGFGVLIRHVLSQRELFRAFMMMSVFDQHMREKGEHINLQRKQALLALLQPFRGEIGHADPDAAIDSAFAIYSSTMRGRLVYYGSRDALQFGVIDEVMFADLKQALTMFLRGESSSLPVEPGCEPEI